MFVFLYSMLSLDEPHMNRSEALFISRQTIFSCNTCTIYLYLRDICQIGNLITIIYHLLDKRKTYEPRYFINEEKVTKSENMILEIFQTMRNFLPGWMLMRFYF